MNGWWHTSETYSANKLPSPTPGPLPFALFQAVPQGAIHNAELAMRHLSYTIRSKPQWWLKCNEDAILQKWRSEAKSREIRGIKLRDEHIDYVFAELQEFIDARTSNGVQVGLDRGFWESDSLVDGDLANRLQGELDKLRNVSGEEKDWHPGSDGQVLDMVHPSLYCGRYDETVLSNGNILQAPPIRKKKGWHRLPDIQWFRHSYGYPNPDIDDEPDSENEGTYRSEESPSSLLYGHSTSTCWLPTDFQVSKDEGSLNQVSYINNVHPEEQTDLNDILRDLLGRFLPMFKRALGDLSHHASGLPHLLAGKLSEFDEDNAVPYSLLPGTERDLLDFRWTAEDELREKIRKEWNKTHKPYIDPLPPTYAKPARLPGDGYEFAGRTLQVITKIAQLIPEKPHYAGGSWHVEGMLNESIVATGIYYSDCDNISVSYLEFRLGLAGEGFVQYEQNDPHQIVARSFSLGDGTPLNQHMGAVEARAGRAIVFPNLYQHRVAPFSLKDATLPGRRTIIAFFLCDPSYRVPSTTDIAPQQAAWMPPCVLEPGPTSRLATLPLEIRKRIVHYLIEEGWIIDREIAEEVRKELMEERSAFVWEQNSEYFETDFDMCEH